MEANITRMKIVRVDLGFFCCPPWSRPRTHSIEGISRAKIKSVKQTVIIILGYIVCSTPAMGVQIWAVWCQHEEGLSKLNVVPVQGRELFFGIRNRPTIPLTRPIFFQRSSRFAIVYQSFCSRMKADRFYYDWITEKNLYGQRCLHILYVLIYLKHNSWVIRPDFFCYPVVIELICCRTRAKGLINDSKTTGWVEKFGRANTSV